MNPLISVLLPTYNCEKYINECMDSILCQTYSNLELLIIDDCSTDNTVNLIQDYKDERIKLTIKEKNTGYTDSLNWGINNCKGEYIARMDGDDISLPTRFEEQVAVLQNNSAISICGSSALILGSTNIIKVPETNEEIFRKFLFENAIIHPSLMFRKEVFKEYKYDRNFEPAEDYNLWTKLIFNFNFYNIQKSLLYYRRHDENVSKKRKEAQRNKFLESQYNFYRNINNASQIIDLKTFQNFYTENSFSVPNFLSIYTAFDKLLQYKKINLKNEVKILEFRTLYQLVKNKPLKISYKAFVYLKWKDKLRFINYYLRNGNY